MKLSVNICGTKPVLTERSRGHDFWGPCESYHRERKRSSGFIVLVLLSALWPAGVVCLSSVCKAKGVPS